MAQVVIIRVIFDYLRFDKRTEDVKFVSLYSDHITPGIQLFNTVRLIVGSPALPMAVPVIH
jgi:hypothetical protein